MAAAANVPRVAYIDHGLAKRHHGAVASAALPDAGTAGTAASVAGAGAGADLSLHRQPASLGKLHEIDLGPDVRARNIAATEAVMRRLEGGQQPQEPAATAATAAAEATAAAGKPRLRRDGKPWRPRRRRNSDDVKRDQLVEEVLRETRCKPRGPATAERA